MKTFIFFVHFETNKGGVPQSVISILKGVSANPNFRLILVCPRNSEISHEFYQDKVTIVTSSSTTWPISKTSIFQAFTVALDIYKKIKQYISKDTFFISNESTDSFMISLLPVLNIKEIYVNRGGNFKGPGFGNLFMRNKIRLKRVYKAVATSSQQKKVLIKNGQPESSITIIHNGLELPQIQYSIKRLESDRLQISTMGFISDLKNQIEGVRLIKMLRDKGVNAILNIYGEPDSDKAYQLKLKYCIRDLGLDNFVFYRGFVKGEELFSETDILISFSRSEGFGRSLVEGMLRKKPVIAYRGAGGPVDITNDGEFGYLVTENKAEDYYKVVLLLLNNPDCYSRNIQKSYQFALDNFTQSVMVSKYSSLFENL